MPSPQKAKGSKFEREIAEFLTETYGENFMRVPNSGAYVGGINVHRKQVMSEGQVRSFKGDIIPGPSYSRFNIECKSYKDFAFNQVLSGQTNKQLENWIEQAMEVADEGDFTVLFMKFNRQGTFIATKANPLLVLPYHGTQYCSINYGMWYFSELNSFFKLNKNNIQTLTETIS